MKRIMLSTISALALMGTGAQAQDENIYVGIDGFASFLGKEKSQSSGLELQNDFKTGVGFAGIIGYDFGKFRLEGEIGKHFHNVDRFNITNDGGMGLISGTAVAGKSNMTHYMANAIFDITNPLQDIEIEPFIGAGMGVSNVSWNNFTTSTAALPYTHGSDNLFTYQAFAGLRAPITDNVDISLKYRYMGTNEADRFDRLGNSFRSSQVLHDVVIGISYKFGGSAQKNASKMPQSVAPVPDPTSVAEIAPAAPAPIPEPVAMVRAEPFAVYFLWDSVALDNEARNIVLKAITESKKADQITIKIDGHADLSGPPGYNDTLSYDRAKIVREAMISAGIDEHKIIIEAHGERMPEIHTDDGVRERQNRRVTIVLN